MDKKNLSEIKSILDTLISDLTLDKENILIKIIDLGWNTTSMTLGYDITNYDNLRLPVEWQL